MIVRRTLLLALASGTFAAHDAIARVLAQRLSEQLGQSVVVDNKPGAGGTLATANTARAKPDGYTLLVTADSAHVIGPALYKQPGFDPVKDFVPVAPIATAGYTLVANPAFPANNVAELVALAKAAPGKYCYASAGNGTLNHLIGEMLQKTAGIQLQHVPYKGSAQTAADVAGGQVPLSVQSLPSVIGLVKSGKLKVLGVVNEKRVAALPDVPTLAEAGVPNTEVFAFQGILAPAGLPAAITARLNGDLNKALLNPAVVKRMNDFGMEALPGTPEQFRAMARAESKRWGEIIKAAGVKLD